MANVEVWAMDEHRVGFEHGQRRAMLRGWITREELMTHHDPKRWQARQKS